MLRHVGIDARRDVMIDQSYLLERDVVSHQDRLDHAKQLLRVRAVGRSLQRTVDRQRLEIGKVRLVLGAQALLRIVQHCLSFATITNEGG